MQGEWWGVAAVAAAVRTVAMSLARHPAVVSDDARRPCPTIDSGARNGTAGRRPRPRACVARSSRWHAATLSEVPFGPLADSRTPDWPRVRRKLSGAVFTPAGSVVGQMTRRCVRGQTQRSGHEAHGSGDRGTHGLAGDCWRGG